MKFAPFLAVRIADQVAQPAAALHAARTVLGIEDDLVDEIAEMKDEAHPVLGRPSFVLEDHAPPGVHRALGRVLAADEGKADRPGIVSAGAVSVRPTRLPKPRSSEKR